MSSYLQRRFELKNGIRMPDPKKEQKPIAKVSEKRAEQIKQEKKATKGDDTAKEKWFKARRRQMVGVCQCGCARKSSKFEDENFRSSICHIFPQRLFESVQFHPLNWVERNFWDGCHSNMDNQSMDKWVNMADWDDLVEKFHVLSALLTDEERAQKFYGHLEKLVYGKKETLP